MSGPPRLATRLLARALRSHAARTAILGDLHEDFARVLQLRGRAAARLWYWREAMGLTSSRHVHALLRTAFTHPGNLVDDAAQALRMLRRSAGFSLFAGAVIGLGVAAVTTVFSVLKPLALDLPFEQPQQLVWIANTGDQRDDSLYAVTSRVVNLIDFRERTRSFSGITGYDAFFAGQAYTLTAGGEPERLVGAGVAHDFLDVLGIEPLYGRGFSADEGLPGGSPAVLLSHGFWRDRFAADPGVVGQRLILNDRPRTVVGVLPAAFDFSSVFAPATQADILLPFIVSRDNAFQGNTLALIGRLRRGVTPEAAQAELSGLVAALEQEDPTRWGLGAKLVTLQEHLYGPFRRTFLLLTAAAVMLLAVVCVNVSGLMLARSPSRGAEMAVRQALGAPRVRLVRQLVIEALGISLVGAAFGSFLAWVATDVVRTAAALQIPLMDSVELDASALMVAAAVAVLTGIGAGSLPALRFAAGGEAGILRAAARGSRGGPGARRLRETLIVAEIALACGLLIAGALLMKSFQAVLNVDLGFEPAHTVAWQLHPGTDFGSLDEEQAFYSRLSERVRAVAGVESAGLIDALPLGRNRSWKFSVADGPPREGSGEDAFPHVIDPGYLTAVQTPLVAGRGLTAGDGAGAPPVVLLNETGARRIFGGAREALNRRLVFWGPWQWEVVGVTRDVRHLSLETEAGIEVYFPLAQMPDFTTMDLVVRSRLPEAQTAAAVSRVLREMDPSMPAREFWSLETTVQGGVSTRRFALGMLSTFGTVALLLAGLGIYGVLSQTVSERRSEIGIRMALGASAREIVRGVAQRMLLLTAGGIAVGWGLALLLSGLLASLLFGVPPTDPASFLAPALVLLAVTALAAGLPARRAVSMEAWQTLRDQ